MSKLIAAFAAAAALTFAGAAHAATITTFNLDVVDPAAGFPSGVNFGTVTVTDNGLDLYIAVALTDGYEFRAAPDSNHHALTFDLDKANQHATGLHGFLADTTEINYFKQSAAVNFKQSPFGNFNYAIECPRAVSASRNHPASLGCEPGWTPADNPTKMDFKLAGLNINDLKSVPYAGPHGAKNIFFSSDIVSHVGGFTGNVGATWVSQTVSVPEPATWGLMIMGFGFMGAGLRRRRAEAAVAA